MDSNFVPFYLKYRPQALSDVIGQEAVKKTIHQAFKNNRLSHAYLFAGPRGTGKTSTARILAKMVNCEDENPPCNKCTSCLSITNGSNLDLIEIDAASNRGIEDIRSLRQNLKLAPTAAKKKIYIIDEAHMLTTEAFNALLKTLEEPPSHALFILATTEVGKIPQTILSRVVRLDFKLAKPGELVETLQKIVKAEKINIDEDVLKILVKKSEGSFRDGVKLLDQVSSGDGNITASNFDETLSLVLNLSKKDTQASLSLIIKQIEGGIECRDLMLTLMDMLRNIVFIKNGLGAELVEPTLMEENYQSLINLSQGFSNQDLINILDILQKAYEKLKVTSIPSLPLELAIVKICEEREPVVIASPAAESGVNSSKQSITHTSPDSPDILKLKEKWPFVLETIRPYNFSLEALLRSARINECSDTIVVMEVPYSFHQRILEAPKNKDLLEGILSDVLGRKIRVSIVLGSRPQHMQDLANVEVAQDDEIIKIASEIFNSDSVN